jgi:integrase/recombinase XerD
LNFWHLACLISIQKEHITAKTPKEKKIGCAIESKILEMLRDYYKVYKPTVYLFEGDNKV